MTKLLSKQAVADRLGLHPETIMRLVREGAFPRPIKIGSSMQAAVRFDEADVAAWIEAKKAASLEST